MLRDCFVENNKNVGNAEAKDEAPVKEQLDAWTAHRTETGTVYYYNALTGESTYEKPSGFKGEVLQALLSSLRISGAIVFSKGFLSLFPYNHHIWCFLTSIC